MSHWRAALVVLGAVLVFGGGNLAILRKQAVVDDGRQVLLRLAPVDPRSLMQGDYMRLRYDQAAFPDSGTADELRWRGTVVLRLDGDDIGSFARADDGRALGPDEIRLVYKWRGGFRHLRYGAETYFFQEGEARRYATARFGVLRVDPDGNSVLIGLADQDQRLIPH